MTDHSSNSESESSFVDREKSDPDSMAHSVDSELARLLDEFVEELNAGRMVNIDEVLSKYPNLREDALAAFESILALHGSRNTVSTAEATEPLVAELGDYRLIREIGRGGMGIVYLAEQKSLARRVAVKILPLASLMDERRLQRFRNESLAAASLRHPGIVRIHTIGHEKGIHYYVMDLIEGADLAEVIASIHGNERTNEQASVVDHEAAEPMEMETRSIAKLSTQRSENQSDFYRSVAKIGIQIAEALHFAHDRGVFHRDVKPGNLLLDASGDAHVTDFGLARMAGQQELTVNSDIVGTLRYMSPEQLDDDTLVDHRSDIYSLGLTLYELLSGQPAFNASSKPALMKQIIEAKPTSIRRLCPAVPDDLATIIEAAMAEDPGERYRSAADLAADLQAFIDIKTIKAKRSTVFDHFRRFAKRSPQMIAACLVLLVAIATISAFAAWNYSAAAAEAEKQNRLQRMGLYAGDMRTAQQLVKEFRFAELLETLLKWVPDDGDEDFRNFEWDHLWEFSQVNPLVHQYDHELRVTGVCFLNESEFVTCGIQKVLKRWSLEPGKNSEPLSIVKLATMDRAGLLLNPTTDKLLIGSEYGALSELDLDSERTTFETVFNHAAGANALDLSPNGNLLLVSGGSFEFGAMRLLDAHSKELLWTSSSSMSKPAVFLSNTKFVHYDNERQVMEVQDAVTRAVLETIPNQARCATQLAINGNREVLAVSAELVASDNGHEEHSVTLWSTRNWEKIAEFDTLSLPVGIQFSPNGKMFAYGTEDGEIGIVDIKDGGSSAVRLIHRRGHLGHVFDVEFSPSGNILATASADGVVRMWNVKELVAHSSSVVECVNFTNYANSTGILSDSKAVMGLRATGCFIWDTDKGERIQTIKLEDAMGSRNHVAVTSSPNSTLVTIGIGHWPPPPGESNATSDIVIWNTRSNTEHGRLAIPATWGATSSAMSLDGKYLAVCTHFDGLFVIDVKAVKIVAKLDGIDPLSCRFSADGTRLVAGLQGGEAHLFAVPSFRCVAKPKLDVQKIYGIDISPDNRTIAAVGSERNLKLYDLKTGNQRVIGDSIAAIRTLVRFTPDGARIMSGALDGKLRLWSTETGEQVYWWDIPVNSWPTGNFTPDASMFVTGGVGFAKSLHAADAGIKRLSRADLRAIANEKLSHVSGFQDGDWKDL